MFLISVASQAIIEEKKLYQPQPTPTVLPDETEDWESGIFPLSVIITYM